MNIQLMKGDCLKQLKKLKDNSVDSVVTDPPYHLTSIVKRFGKEDSAKAQYGTDGAFQRASKGFMGKEWDGGDIAFRPDVWEECYRVLKPGGHLLAFSHSRTYHRMGVAVEDAGFEIRDQIMWVYGSGFPKSHNIGKAVDKLQGNEREVIGTKKGQGNIPNDRGNWGLKPNTDVIVDKGNSEWEGWGTALKPAHEPIVMARKPFKGSIAQNVLEWGTGGINIDDCRVGTEKVSTHSNGKGNTGDKGIYGTYANQQGSEEREGRFPANIIFDEEAGKILDEQSGNKTGQRGVVKGTEPSHSKKNAIYGDYSMVDGKYAEPIDDLGGASRFFYCPKAQKKDRNEGMPEEVPTFTGRPRREDGSVIYKETHPEEWAKAMEGKPRKEKTSLAAAEEKINQRPVGVAFTKEENMFNQKGRMNIHPTVKPTDLMTYLVRLVTPKGGTVLDPFMGSGSTGKAAIREGMDFIGIEREDEYMEIAKTRIEHEKGKHNYRKFFDI